jgi:RNA polymerase sigma-70 factor (TIGR02943 family)
VPNPPESPAVHAAAPSSPAAWVDAHGDILFRYALLRLRSRDAAEEVVQETFLAALKSRDTFRQAAAEQTWLIGILKHKILDHFRNRKRDNSTADAPDPAIDRAFTPNGHWKDPPKRWAVDASILLERAEFWEIFNTCMADLPESMADAFALRILDDTDPATVCQVLTIAPTNLWMLLHRARTRLRKCLEAKWFKTTSKGPH